MEKKMENEMEPGIIGVILSFFGQALMTCVLGSYGRTEGRRHTKGSGSGGFSQN